MADLRINAGILLGSVFLYIVALNTAEVGNSTIDSMLWPKVILILLMVLSLYSAVHSLLTERKQRLAGTQRIKQTRPVFQWSKGAMIGIIPIIAAFLYIFVMQYVGFFLTTFLFIPIMMFMLGDRKILRMALTSALFLVFVWAVFVKSAMLLFPAGDGIFRILSQYIMFGS